MVMAAAQHDLLRDALAYSDRGWTCFPVSGKKPLVKWKHRTEPAADDELREMFERRGATGIALLMGAPSGGLAARDFDVKAGYAAWCEQNPKLAKTLPTYTTG